MVMIGPWQKGMNNLLSDHDLFKGNGEDVVVSCRNAVNVDFGDSGKAKRRKGFTKVHSAINTKGGYSCPAGMFFIEQLALKLFNSNHTSTVLFNGVYGSEYTFCYENGIVYFSDGIICLKITNGVVTPWGMSNPPPPVLLGTAGSYGGGLYQAALCWVDADGVESGASDIARISLDSNSGVKFINLPSGTTGAAYLRLYLSMPDGKELYHVADVTPGLTEYQISSGRYDEGNTLEHLFVSPPPAGRIIGFYKGRMYVADATGIVWYSDPFEPSHFRTSPANNYILFPSPVDIMIPVTNGIFFAYGNHTDFYAGTPDAGFDIIPKFQYGGVFGTGKKIPNSDNVCWQSQRGFVIGAADGSAKNIQEENVAPDSAEFGAGVIVERDGNKQFITSLSNTSASPLAANSWITAEVLRRGEL